MSMSSILPACLVLVLLGFCVCEIRACYQLNGTCTDDSGMGTGGCCENLFCSCVTVYRQSGSSQKCECSIHQAKCKRGGEPCGAPNPNSYCCDGAECNCRNGNCQCAGPACTKEHGSCTRTYGPNGCCSGLSCRDLQCKRPTTQSTPAPTTRRQPQPPSPRNFCIPLNGNCKDKPNDCCSYTTCQCENSNCRCKQPAGCKPKSAWCTSASECCGNTICRSRKNNSLRRPQCGGVGA